MNYVHIIVDNSPENYYFGNEFERLMYQYVLFPKVLTISQITDTILLTVTYTNYSKLCYK